MITASTRLREDELKENWHTRHTYIGTVDGVEKCWKIICLNEDETKLKTLCLYDKNYKPAALGLKAIYEGDGYLVVEYLNGNREVYNKPKVFIIRSDWSCKGIDIKEEA